MFFNRLLRLTSKKFFSVAFAAALLIIAVCGVYAAEPPELEINISLPALPVITSVTQSIEIALPDGVPDGMFEATVSSESGWGIMLFQTGPSDSGKIHVSREAPARLEYRWSGVSPVNAPVFETIKASIPELGVSCEIGFNVGVDLRIKEISMPAQITPGIFNNIEIVLEDTFNPTLNVADLVERTGVKPEIMMSLSGGGVIIDDPVVRAFFDTAETAGEQSYPGKDFKPGSVIARNGKFLWQCEEGKPSGITPSSTRGFIIEATLKSNLGGTPLKQWSSSALGESGRVPRIEDLPELIASTIGIMSQLDQGAAAETESAARKFLASGNANEAALALGAPLRKSFEASLVPSLGKFSSALAESGKREAEIVSFLETIMKDFDGAGVLLFTRNGVEDWILSSGALAYDNARYVAVPFSSRQNITVTLTGSSLEDVSLWKIIPEGTNTRSYEKGHWIKEITVFTSEVQPSH